MGLIFSTDGSPRKKYSNEKAFVDQKEETTKEDENIDFGNFSKGFLSKNSLSAVFQDESTYISFKKASEMETCSDYTYEKDKNCPCPDVFVKLFTSYFTPSPLVNNVSDFENDLEATTTKADKLTQDIGEKSEHILKTETYKEREIYANIISDIAFETEMKTETNGSWQEVSEDIKSGELPGFASEEDYIMGLTLSKTDFMEELIISNSFLPAMKFAVLKTVHKILPNDAWDQISFETLNIDKPVNFTAMTDHYNTRFFYYKPSDELTYLTPQPQNDIFPHLEESDIIACLGTTYFDLLL